MTPERRERLVTVLDHRQPDITVVLENVTDPHNISAVMRTCDAIGIQDIYILNTRIGVHKKWGAKSSSSASKWVTTYQFTNTQECVRTLRMNYSKILTTHLSTEAVSLHDLDLTTSIALVFGNEHDGVSQEMRELADGNFIIPQVGMIRSLNISVACAVTLYEAMRQKIEAGHYKDRRLPEQRVTQLTEEWGYGYESFATTDSTKKDINHE